VIMSNHPVSITRQAGRGGATTVEAALRRETFGVDVDPLLSAKFPSKKLEFSVKIAMEGASRAAASCGSSQSS
jgi:hypothetical protein